MKSSIAAVVALNLVAVFSTSATAGDLSSEEKRKAHVVSRFYAVTYGSGERCKKAAPEGAAEFQEELIRFLDEEWDLMDLIKRSPYFEAARKDFDKYGMIAPHETPELLSDFCKHLARELRKMRAPSEGARALDEVKALLSK